MACGLLWENKMTTYYSKSTKGFYPEDIFADNERPSDCVEITLEYQQELLRGETEDKIIIADENGYPILADKPKPTPEQLAVIVRNKRDSELSWFDSVCYRNQFYWAGLSADTQAVRLQFRTKLLNVPEQSGFPESIEWPIRPEITE